MSSSVQAGGSDPFPDQAKKSFDFAADLTKQLITLSTGIIALVITFSKDFLTPSMPNASGNPTAIIVPVWLKLVLIVALVLFLISIVAGIFTYGQLVRVLQVDSAPSVGDTSVKGAARIQWICFGAGLLLAISYVGWVTVILPR